MRHTFVSASFFTIFCILSASFTFFFSHYQPFFFIFNSHHHQSVSSLFIDTIINLLSLCMIHLSTGCLSAKSLHQKMSTKKNSHVHLLSISSIRNYVLFRLFTLALCQNGVSNHNITITASKVSMEMMRDDKRMILIFIFFFLIDTK